MAKRARKEKGKWFKDIYTLNRRWVVNTELLKDSCNVMIYCDDEEKHHVLKGQIMRDGCCDWGGFELVCLHTCGRDDMRLFMLMFDRAMKLMGGENIN